MPIQLVESGMTKMTASPPCVIFKWLCLTFFQLCVIDTQTEHVWTLDMVDRSHIGSEVKSDSINRKAITYLVGNYTLTLFLQCWVPKLKHVKTFDTVHMSGDLFEFGIKFMIYFRDFWKKETLLVILLRKYKSRHAFPLGSGAKYMWARNANRRTKSRVWIPLISC